MRVDALPESFLIRIRPCLITSSEPSAGRSTSEAKSQPSVMAGAGINFRGDGGALVIRIPHPENALTRTREAEHVFDELLRRGKLFHDSEPMTSFQGFHMREFTGHDGLAYAALRPSAQLNAEQNQVTRLLHTFMYGGSEKDMPI